MTPPTDPWLSPEQAAAETGTHVDTIRKACRAGHITASKVGRHWKIRRSALDLWLESGAAA